MYVYRSIVFEPLQLSKPVFLKRNLTSKSKVAVYKLERQYVFQHCCIAANPGPLPVAICEFLNDTTCPTYKESSGYLSRIRYRMLKFGTVYNQRPSKLCLAIGSYVSLATSSVCLRSDCFLPWIEFRRKSYRCSVQAIQRRHLGHFEDM